MSTFDEERQAFMDFLAQASAEVATWPKWKQNILVYLPDPDTTEPPMRLTHPSNKITAEELDNVFSYHRPTPDQAQRHEAVKVAAKAFAAEILKLAPDCADRSAAIRHVREAMMTASAAIALE